MTLDVALAGCGNMGHKRAAALGQDRLTVCYDVDADAAGELARATGAVACGSLDELLERGADVVLVATSHDALAETASRALAAGAHVLVEKPGARTVEELDTIADQAASSGRLLKVGFNHRFHPGIARAAEEALSGAHGEIMFVRGRYGHGGRLGYEREWRMRPEVSGGGELMDQGMHMLDLSHWLLGPLPLHSALLRTNFWEVAVEDNALLILADPGERGPWSTFHVSWTEWKNEFALEVYCQRAKLQVSGLWGSYGRQTLRIYRMRPELGPPDEEVVEYGEEDESWAAEWQFFRELVLSGSEPRPEDLDSARYALATIEDAYRLNRSGKTLMRDRLAPLLRARFLRFALTGALVAAVYFAVTAALALLAHAPTQLAVVVGYVCSLALHFTVNRRFVFASSSGYALHLSAQGGRYIAVALSSYTCTALLVALSEHIDLPQLLVALAVPIMFAALTFVTLRGWVFRSAVE